MTYIIIDLEATCQDKGEFPKEEMETIEIGAVVLGDGLEVVATYKNFIKPVRNPILTDFCKSLTGITQFDVDTAREFVEVFQEFSDWFKGHGNGNDGFAFYNWRDTNPTFCSWGMFDLYQFKRDCKYHNIDYTLSDEHINIKELYSKNQSRKKSYGLGKAIRKEDLEFEGNAHRALDDAKNMARIAYAIFKD